MNIDTNYSNVPTDPIQRNQLMRKMVDEVVGTTFFEPMLKSAHNSVLKGKYGHGGRGEEMFQGQLNIELARCIGRGVKTGSLADALYRKFSGQSQSVGQPTATVENDGKFSTISTEKSSNASSFETVHTN